MLFDGDFTLTDQIVDSHECRRENLIGMMQDVQEHYKYLPPEVLVKWNCFSKFRSVFGSGLFRSPILISYIFPTGVSV